MLMAAALLNFAIFSEGGGAHNAHSEPKPAVAKSRVEAKHSEDKAHTDAKPIVVLKPLSSKLLSNNPNINAQSKAKILETALQDLSQKLVGTYSNSNQVFFASELGINEAPPKIFISVKELAPTTAGKATLGIEYRLGTQNGKILRSRLWRLNTDIDGFAVKVAQFELNPDDKNDVTYLQNCDLKFQGRGSGYSGFVSNCPQISSNGKKITLSERHEIDQTSWEITDLALDENSYRAFGNIGSLPSTYLKSNQYVCWVSMGDKSVGNLKINDQGGEVRADFGSKSVRLRLSQVVWPYGQNRPSLTLYLLTTPDDYSQFYSWTDIGANRIALSYSDYQASCTKND